MLPMCGAPPPKNEDDGQKEDDQQIILAKEEWKDFQYAETWRPAIEEFGEEAKDSSIK